MNWWSIRIDPLPLPQRLIAQPHDRGGPVGRSYRLWLPLIADGRISIPLFRAEPARARIVSLGQDANCQGGRIALRDHQWFCLWPVPAAPGMADWRIVGARFAAGEIVGLRPLRGRIALYRVNERTVA